MQPLAVLARLAALEVEHERRALAALDEQLDRLRREIEQAMALALSERRHASDLTGARTLALYLEAHRQRLRAAEAERASPEEKRARQLARLLDSRLELKRLELLQARLQRRRRTEALRRERRDLDELALLTRTAGR
jgi:flagellar biosynthesis chaperone FliJ